MATLALLCACSQGNGPRTVEDFNFGWKFSLGDSPEFGKGFNVYTHAEWASPEFDDSQWRSLDLPHDFQFEQPWDSLESKARAFKKMCDGWYRKTFIAKKDF